MSMRYYFIHLSLISHETLDTSQERDVKKHGESVQAAQKLVCRSFRRRESENEVVWPAQKNA